MYEDNSDEESAQDSSPLSGSIDKNGSPNGRKGDEYVDKGGDFNEDGEGEKKPSPTADEAAERDGVNTKSLTLGDEADQAAEARDLRDTQCGLSTWRPTYLQPFASMWAFTATISAYTVFGNIHYTYYSAVITQIERRFVFGQLYTFPVSNNFEI